MKPVLSSKSKFRLLRAFLACTGFALWSATSAACQEAVTAEHLRKAAALFKSSCSSCHLPPDPQLRTDRAWLNQVLDTAWSSTPKQARRALIEYLSARPFPLPHVIQSASAPHAGEGTLSTDLQAGELFLEDDQQQSYRLSWTKNESGDARLRSLPAGNYRLRTYRMEREQDGQFWHASASGQNIQRVTLRAGQNTHLELDQSITIHSKINKGQAQMGISGQKGAGLSIYRDSVRIPMGYRLLSSEGEQLASGSMNYGWGGGGWAPLESVPKASRIELVYAKPPFEIKGG